MNQKIMKALLVVSLFANLIIVGFLGYKRIRPVNPRLLTTDTAMFNTWDDSRQSELSSLKIDSGDVVFVGNSLTEGFPVDELFGAKNRGISGNRSSHVASRIKGIARAKPSKIFIEIGLNDLTANIPEATVIKNINQIVSIIRDSSPATEIFLHSITPVGENRNTYNADIVSCNKLLKKLCEDKQISYIDLHSVLVKDNVLNPEYSLDGTHLNGNGYQLWEKEINKYLK